MMNVHDQAVLMPHLSHIGRYQIEAVLGQGSSGTVLRACDEDGHTVAIKLSTGLKGRDRDRFMQEINACRRLDHPGIVRVFDVGEHEGQLWYAMAYHGAVSLADVLACNQADMGTDLPGIIAAVTAHTALPQPYHLRRLLPVPVVLDLMVRICQAMDHAHGRGLLHRDLKPDNILLSSDGQPVICDFGLVADLERRRRLTQTGRVLGTIGYAAPEVHTAAATHMVDERSDVYALGVILRELLTGMPPHPGLSSHGTQGGTLRDSAVRLMRRRLRVLPRPLRIIINRAAHRQAHRRYHSVRALLADLQRFRQAAPIAARPDPLVVRLWHLGREHRWCMAVCVVVLVFASVLVIRHRTLLRLEASRWASPAADYDFASAAGLSATRTFAGRWRHSPEGAVPDDEPGLWQALGYRTRVYGPHRVRSRMRTPESGVVGLFAAGRGSYDDGYRLVLPVAGVDAGQAVLYGGEQVLWLADMALAPGARHAIEMEITSTSVIIRLDTSVLTVIEDTPVRHGGWAGVLQRTDAGSGGAVLGLVVQGRTLPSLASAQWLAGALVSKVVHSNDQVLVVALWDEVWAACGEVAASDPLAAVVLRSQAWPAVLQVPEADRPPAWRSLEQPRRDLIETLMAVDVSLRDVHWERAMVMVALGRPEVPDEHVLHPLAERWHRRPSQRDSLLLFLMHVAHRRPEVADMLRRFVTGLIESDVPTSPVLERARHWAG